MKLSWGQAIFIVLTAFVAMMVYFMIRAAGNQEELVAQDYYAQELRYQERIDRMDRAASWGAPVDLSVIEGELMVTFPDTLRGRSIEAELHLLKPSDSRADLRLPFTLMDTLVFRISTADLMKGAYRAAVDWTVDGVEHRTEQPIYLP